MAESKEVIPGVTESDVDTIADFVFSRTDSNHPEFDSSPEDIVRILQDGGNLAVQSQAFFRPVKS